MIRQGGMGDLCPTVLSGAGAQGEARGEGHLSPVDAEESKALHAIRRAGQPAPHALPAPKVLPLGAALRAVPGVEVFAAHAAPAAAGAGGVGEGGEAEEGVGGEGGGGGAARGLLGEAEAEEAPQRGAGRAGGGEGLPPRRRRRGEVVGCERLQVRWWNGFVDWRI